MENHCTNGFDSCPAPTKVSVLNCIDLSSSDIQQSVSLLKQVLFSLDQTLIYTDRHAEACLDCGFFYVVNHGISEEFMGEVFAQSKRLFNLPLDEKMKLLRNEKHRGYTPVLDELLDPDNQVHGDYKEGYYTGVEVPEDDLETEKPFYGPNVWPENGVLPGWRETMEKFHREALEVARAVARIIALALDLEVDFFDKPEMLGKPIAVLRLLHYEGKISDPNKGIYGCGAHSDYGLITLLATDDITGLQICKDKDAKPQKWEYIAPLKGAFIVNLGDMLERWSNCVFKSTLHRVLGNGQERYSIAYFVEPSHDCLVECLPTCKSENNPPKFSPIKCATYLSQRYKDTHTDLSVYNQNN
ncbi:2-oxoglutarate-Fe(II) type oxidoreductase isoform X2 [Carica papaya]|uniref:2-oxoglutarate-Fe(II) type oxidoreductase isoform X2 n=1 Tax=Carica papaya TaxID=3649 RepID=UPI000B8C872F|nr:2-oxoglutarate-Fe(II) type oxidoreductase isoform X2 [Carica papaya]